MKESMQSTGDHEEGAHWLQWSQNNVGFRYKGLTKIQHDLNHLFGIAHSWIRLFGLIIPPIWPSTEPD